MRLFARKTKSARGRTAFAALSESQRRQLEEWLADGKQWISVDETIKFIKTRVATTLGHAQKLLKDARASGAVQYANDDGMVRDPRYDYAYRKDDLAGWLDRQALQKPGKPKTRPRVHRYRHAEDAALIKEGRRMVNAGMTKLAAAKKLAPRAVGGTVEQRIERLRKLI
jgi:hypothetical protein